MTNKLCKCGCGKEIVLKQHHKYYGVPEYIRGHNGRIDSEIKKQKRYEYTKQWKKDNKEYYKQHMSELKKEKKYHRTDAAISKIMLKRYDITLEDYRELLIEQDHKCAICGIHKCDLTKNLAVDHNHTTGKVRGLLCSNCNLLLGKIENNIDLLPKIFEYLDMDYKNGY